MKGLLKHTFLRKTILGYRKLRHRRGHGVHSPFVFALITKVIEERGSYYSYQDIELLRKQYGYRTESVTFPDQRRKGRERTLPLGRLFQREAIPARKGTLLFRLANYYKPGRILQIGGSIDLSALYLTASARDTHCVVMEHVPSFVPVAREILDKRPLLRPVSVHEGNYAAELPQVLAGMGSPDFVFFNIVPEQTDPVCLFRECIIRANEQTIFVFNEIKSNVAMRSCWQEVCASPEITVAVDLYSLGIAFVNKKLHKRIYKAYLK